MNFIEHLIVGGGISGCLMARHLSEHQLDFKLVEAQPFLGGRIQSTQQGLDLGPTWFWPHQSGVEALLSQLNIESFTQYTQGDYVYQAGPNNPVQRGNDQQGMLSYRVAGGMGAIINALHNTIADHQVLLNSPVKSISKQGVHWQVQLHGGDTFTCQHLWLALPPRIAAPLFLAADHCVLSDELISHLQKQQTWMSAQAKFVAVYENSFWRDNGLSGQGFSHTGPMVEINDASGESVNNNASPAALFGFIGIPATNRKTLDEQQIIDACIAQLGKLFGEAALSPISTHYIDWASNEFIATAADISEPSQHAHFNQAKFETELQDLKLGLIGSEFSQAEPGYIAGAIDHVNDVVIKL
jgi:monoamine oxidase